MNITSILKKVAMAFTGLSLFLFLIGHLGGNLLLLSGPGKFNAYAGGLAAIPLVVPVEIGLLALAILHVISGVQVTLENWAARPQGYVVKKTAGASTFASRTMWIGGIVVGAFIVWHVWMFKYGSHDLPGGLYELVVTAFHNPLIVAGYVFALVILGLHLSHGFSSALQTLGVNRPHWRPRLLVLGAIVGWAIALGFLALPIWAFFLA